MITQIEIDGFKTFSDFKVDLAPFQVLVGPNGSGKSNLFDALRLLSRLAEYDLSTAFQGLRGSADDQFTKYPDGKRANRMRFAVEMLVDRNLEDDLGRNGELVFTRLHYEIEIALRKNANIPNQLYVTYENLKAIPQETDTWSKKYNLASSKYIPIKSEKDTHTFFSFGQKNSEHAILNVHYLDVDNKAGNNIRIFDETQSFDPQRVKRTMLSSNILNLSLHAIAVQEELRSLRPIIHLNPKFLRQPSAVSNPPYLLPDGGNLPTVLARMQAENEFALADVSLDVANLVPNLTTIELKRDDIRNEYSIWANYLDAPSISSYTMSDGTLCLLALATLANDPEFRGILCLEEPENSVDSLYLKRIAQLLKGMATDFTDPEQAEEPLRQVLVTTHSPTLISIPEILNSVLFAHLVTRVEPLSSGKPTMQVTEITPVQENKNGATPSAYSLDQIKKYLNGDLLNTARTTLEKR